MSKWSDTDERFERAVFVSRQHPDDIDLLDAIAHYSRADPTDLTAGEEVADA